MNFRYRAFIVLNLNNLISICSYVRPVPIQSQVFYNEWSLFILSYFLFQSHVDSCSWLHCLFFSYNLLYQFKYYRFIFNFYDLSLWNMIICCYEICYLCYRNLQCDRNTIHKNLVFCLMLAETVFLIGIGLTGNRVSNHLFMKICILSLTVVMYKYK